MKKIFLDTNILLDLLAQREPFFNETYALFALIESKEVDATISSLSIATLSYVLSRQLPAKEVKKALRKISLLTEALPLDKTIINLALEDEQFHDFEDALQYFTALIHQQDIIITRNLSDFKPSELPCMTSRQFLAIP